MSEVVNICYEINIRYDALSRTWKGNQEMFDKAGVRVNQSVDCCAISSTGNGFHEVAGDSRSPGCEKAGDSTVQRRYNFMLNTIGGRVTNMNSFPYNDQNIILSIITCTAITC